MCKQSQSFRRKHEGNEAIPYLPTRQQENKEKTQNLHYHKEFCTKNQVRDLYHMDSKKSKRIRDPQKRTKKWKNWLKEKKIEQG
jgi:hypothetical protein